MKECINCNGTGEIIVIEGQVEYTCPICNGTGKVHDIAIEIMNDLKDEVDETMADEYDMLDGIAYFRSIDY